MSSSAHSYEVVWVDSLGQWVARTRTKHPLAGIDNTPEDALANLTKMLVEEAGL